MSLMAKISVVICLAMTINDIEFAYLVNLPNSSGELVEKGHKTVSVSYTHLTLPTIYSV